MKEKKEELIFKVTRKRVKLFKKLQKLQKKNWSKRPGEYGKDAEEVEVWLANLSDKDFYDMMMLPIGNYSKIHYTMMRKRKRKELGIE